MAKRRTFTICGRLFKTKVSLEREARRIRDAQPLGVPLDAGDHAFIEDLFRQLYPEKGYRDKQLGVGAEAIRVVSIMGGRCFRFLLSNGRAEEPSLRVCFQPSLAKTAPSARAAFRFEVWPDCVHYRDRYFAQHGDSLGRAPCELTGELVTVAGCEIDHVPPSTFQVILDAYLTAQGLSLEGVSTKDPPDGRGVILADRAQANDWRVYHLSRAAFRVVSKQAHVEETRKQRVPTEGAVIDAATWHRQFAEHWLEARPPATPKELLRASVHFSMLGGNPGDAAGAVLFSDGRYKARRIGVFSNCLAARHAVELALDEAGEPVRISTCMTAAMDGDCVWADVDVRVRMKLALTGSRIEFRHKKKAPEVFDKLRNLARKSLLRKDPIWKPSSIETSRAWAAYQAKRALARQAAEEEQRRWWAAYTAYLASPEWRARREPVLRRARGICEQCHTARAVHVHHVTYEHLFDEPPEDLMAVCLACHETIHDRRFDEGPRAVGVWT
jgi:hypothetical protein